VRKSEGRWRVLNRVGPWATAPSPAPPVASLELVAELVDPGRPVPYCGFLHMAVVMRYRPISVLKGAYSGDSLYVVHGCPERPRSSYEAAAGTLQVFRVGDRHHLVLSKLPLPDWPTRSGPSIDDGFKDKAVPRYRALRTDLASP